MKYSEPDPKRVRQVVINLRDAFQAAADNSTAEAKPLFQNVSEAFNRAIAEPFLQGSLDIEMFSIAMADMLMKTKPVFTQLNQMAREDFKVENTLRTLYQSVNAEMLNLEKIMRGEDVPQKAAAPVPPPQGPKLPKRGRIKFN